MRKDIESTTQSIIAPGTIIDGNIYSKNSIKIEGEIKGKIESKETIIVFETGKVNADIKGKQVIISGEVNGNILATERLEITARGRVKGDITAPRISISEGVFFEGKCSMQMPSAQPTSATPATSTTPTGQTTQASQIGQASQAPPKK